MDSTLSSPNLEIGSLPTFGSRSSSPHGYRNRHSILDLPSAKSRNAPTTFRGQASELRTFLRQFERLAALHQLSSAEKCLVIGDYCSTKVKETLEGFKSCREQNWTQFKADIERVYDIEAITKRFSPGDLAKLCKKFKDEERRPLDNLKAWKHYVR